MHKRICVVGAGRWGTRHLQTLHELDSLAAVVEVDDGRREAARAAYPDIEVYDELDRALVDGYDGFTVATPADTHAAIAEHILQAGVAVLVEKPLALDVASARRLRDLAAGSGLTLMVGHVMLFHPAIREIKKLIRQGKIGKLEYLYSNRVNLGTVRSDENILWSFAPHDVSIFQYLIEARPTSVTSRGGTFIRPAIHDTTLTVLTYPRNVVGHIFVSWLHPFKEHRLVVIGSKGMLSYDDSSEERPLLYYEKGIDWVNGEPIKRDGPTETIAYPSCRPLTEQMRSFCAHLTGPAPEIGGADAAVEVLEILEDASRSLLGGDPVPAVPRADGGVFVHESSVVDEGVSIGCGSKIWHFCHVQSGARIGKHCTLGQNVYVGSHVRIGNHVKIQNNVSVYEGVELEDYVFCGPAMVFTNVHDPRCKHPKSGSAHYSRTCVREGASIGANATIVCGNTVGRHALVAAGAVVTCDVPDHALMVGVPARQAGWVCECGATLPPFDRRVTCRRCERRYGFDGARLAELPLQTPNTAADPAADSKDHGPQDPILLEA